ncbi:MAG: polyribonucleotide nucleotidyltransferase [Thiotrichaceae bacterium]|jgi:polyribonucleotide nucleotidyltransferase|nr:MAG: polyribonucleotide nucleotidyltransferase [Thiotrichaceae bacterium]
MSEVKRTFSFGKHEITLETGNVAKQTNASVITNISGTTVLTTVVGHDDGQNRDFFPLTVNYQEKAYAAGKIPGGFFKREGRPTEKETLTSRLIDRPLRPLFPKNFTHEVQVICTVLSLNNEIDPDIASMIGSSAALMISGMPFNGPLGAVRVGYINNEYVLNPTISEVKNSDLDLVVAGTNTGVLMVESEAKMLSEKQMLDAVNFGHDEIKKLNDEIMKFVNDSGIKSYDFQPLEKSNDDELEEKIKQAYSNKIEDAFKIADKVSRNSTLKEISKSALNDFLNEEESNKDLIINLVRSIEKDIVRKNVLEGKPRIDGRDSKTVRNISIETGLLERTHGSALFTRGETQALVVTTLGTDRDSQIIDALEGEYKDRFMLHYNFPPYSVGECGFVGSPKRREIGHGRLAKRAVVPVIPEEKDFPYVLRVVSEITESNGSSSMASVCGAILSLMDAGVPIKSPVAGIAMGLVKEGDKYTVLSDILGDEDHLGDMDFKVAGTENGVTALQMDIKIDGITQEIMQVALEQARDGRIHILNKMSDAISKPNDDVSKFAPRFITIKINPSKVKDVIGKGGATIRSLTEETGAVIDISDDGSIKISSSNLEAAESAKKKIETLTEDVEVDKIYEGKVVKIMDFGAFVSVLPGKDGLVHISQISNERVENVTDKVNEGDIVKVKVIEIDKQGRIKLSMKAVDN